MYINFVHRRLVLNRAPSVRMDYLPPALSMINKEDLTSNGLLEFNNSFCKKGQSYSNWDSSHSLNVCSHESAWFRISYTFKTDSLTTYLYYNDFIFHYQFYNMSIAISELYKSRFENLETYNDTYIWHIQLSCLTPFSYACHVNGWQGISRKLCRQALPMERGDELIIQIVA